MSTIARFTTARLSFEDISQAWWHAASNNLTGRLAAACGSISWQHVCTWVMGHAMEGASFLWFACTPTIAPHVKRSEDNFHQSWQNSQKYQQLFLRDFSPNPFQIASVCGVYLPTRGYLPAPLPAPHSPAINTGRKMGAWFVADSCYAVLMVQVVPYSWFCKKLPTSMHLGM